MRHGQAITSILVVVAGVLVIGGGVRAASGTPLPAESGSPSAAPTASPSASPIPVARPASAAVVGWARHWRRAAIRSWKRWDRARSAFGLRVVSFGTLSARSPRRAESNARWLERGRGWKHDRSKYNARFAGLWHDMNNPGGSGWERWRPLVRWVWPAGCVDTVIRIMRYESGGNPRILNGGYVLPAGAGDGQPVNRAGGLMQCLPAPRHWADPYFNLWYAFHKKFIPAGWSFSPWAGCNAFN